MCGIIDTLACQTLVQQHLLPLCQVLRSVDVPWEEEEDDDSEDHSQASTKRQTQDPGFADKEHPRALQEEDPSMSGHRQSLLLE